MSNNIIHYTNNRSPSLLDTITSDGVAVDLTGSTVKFQMRLVGSTTLKVDTAATVVTPAAGTVRYDWALVDVNTSGYYTGWWHVTLPGGNVQDTPEFLVEIRDHAPVAQEYISVEELKSSLSLAGQQFADQDIARAISAASRAIDQICDRRFYADTVDVTRTYIPMSSLFMPIDDLSSFTSMSQGGTTWTQNTDFYFEPTNAPANGQPWTSVKTIGKPFIWTLKDIQPYGGYVDPRITLVGKYGWATTPPEVVEATGILATRLMKRSREAAFGVLSLGIDAGAIEIARYDTDVQTLIDPYVRPVT